MLGLTTEQTTRMLELMGEQADATTDKVSNIANAAQNLFNVFKSGGGFLSKIGGVLGAVAPFLSLIPGVGAIGTIVAGAAGGVLSGLAGVKLLTTRTSHILERLTLLDDRFEHMHIREKLNNVLRRADSLALENRLEHALAKYDEALRTDPRCEAAYIGKAKVLQERCKWDDAISTLSRLLEMNPSSERAFYLRACYKSAAGKYRNEEILEDLKSAVARDPLYKTYAALQEKHFENLRDDPEFRNIIG